VTLPEVVVVRLSVVIVSNWVAVGVGVGQVAIWCSCHLDVWKGRRNEEKATMNVKREEGEQASKKRKNERDLRRKAGESSGESENWPSQTRHKTTRRDGKRRPKRIPFEPSGPPAIIPDSAN
jgi:hypothetical protein